MATDTKNPVFTYKIGFEKTGSRYRLKQYNSPYKNSEQELEDMSLMFDGIDLNGQELPSYRVIKWDSLEDGDWEAEVNSFYTPNPEQDGTFDQIFLLKTLTKLS